MPRRVRIATFLSFLLHGCFVLTASYRLSYDAYAHMFFADHYAKDWFSLWDARWFGGFEVVSYPPLVHQLIGLLGHLIGIEPAYAALQWFVLTLYPAGIYFFSRIFFGRSVSSYAALGTSLLSSLYYVTYAFGQLPTLTATLFALFGLSALADFLRTGNKLSGALSIALITVTMASHHATLLFLPWGLAAIVLHLFINDKLNKVLFFSRLGLFVLFSFMSAGIVIWPFWSWGTHQQIQTPIDHLSRRNFLLDPFALTAFFLPIYSGLIFLIPIILWKGFQRKTIGLTIAFLCLLILGLGGTTPLPHLLFGKSWEWLTYDRFAFWASLILVLFLGPVLIYIRHILPGWISIKIESSMYKKSAAMFSIDKSINLRKWATNSVFVAFAFGSLLAGSIPRIFHTQPNPVDMRPILDFLNSNDNSNWRYLTFGFGDQTANLSRLVNATTIDGSYFTARTLPILRESGIGLIDTAFWSDKGITALDPILDQSGEYGVRWGFVDRKEYIPELRKKGWDYVTLLSNGIQVWENPNATLPVVTIPPAESKFKELSWGILPMFSLCITITLAILRFTQFKRS